MAGLKEGPARFRMRLLVAFFKPFAHHGNLSFVGPDDLFVSLHPSIPFPRLVLRSGGPDRDRDHSGEDNRRQLAHGNPSGRGAGYP